MTETLLFKIAAGFPLAYALYMVIKCPCERLVSCSMGEFYVAIGFATTVVAICNLKDTVVQ